MNSSCFVGALACAALLGCSDDDDNFDGEVPVDAIREVTAEKRDELIAVRRDLHMHPELSGEEVRTAGVVAARLRALGLEVRTGVGGHGVVGVLRGQLPGPVVAYRADMDAMPDTEPPGRPYGSTVPGKFHICGHDVHTAIGIGVAEVLAELRRAMRGTVVFLFQPAEETLEGAAAMLRDGALADPRPEAIYALHDGPLPVGTIAYGVGLAGHDDFEVKLVGADADAALAARIANAVNELSNVAPPTDLASVDELIANMRRADGPYAASVSVRSRASDGAPFAVGGSIKVATDDLVAPTRAQIAQIVEREAGLGNYALTFAPAAFPATASDPAVTAAAVAPLVEMIGASNAMALHAPIPFSSEDYALFLREIPGTMFFLGVADRANGILGFPHFPDFDIDERAIAVGTEAMSAVLWHRLHQK